MSLSGLIHNLWLITIAGLIGGSEVFGLSSFALGFLAAICIVGDNVIITYIGLLTGLVLGFTGVEVVRYGIIMLGIAAILNLKSMVVLRDRVMLLSLVAGLFTIVVNVSVSVLQPDVIKLSEAFLEGAFVFSLSMIYSYALNIIKEDYAKIATENEAAISVIILASTVLLGMPIELPGGIIFAETFAVFSILFATYRFGFGIGISWTAIAGAIMSYELKNSTYLTAWMIVTAISFAVLCLLRGGRIFFTLAFAVIYYLCGAAFYGFLLDEESIKAVLSALLIFLLAPSEYMIRVDERVKSDELSSNSPEWGKLVLDRINTLASAFKRMEYTLASDVNVGIGFKEVGEIIENFTNRLENAVPIRKTIETKIIDSLSIKGIQVKNLVLMKNKDGRYEVYITSRIRRGRLVTADVVKNIIGNEMGMEFVVTDESRRIVSRNYGIICLMQKPQFICKAAVRRLSRYEDEVSGDNFYIGDISDGKKLMIIADGMGNGKNAFEDSNSLIEILEELLEAGFDNDVSIRIVNTYLSERNKGESFSTLDMLLLDLHTGYGKMYKQGAATTYIKRGEWMEMIKSTSLPVGVIDNAVCEKCTKKFYNNDIIVMVSDGVLESIIFENKEDYMRELLSEIDMDEPEDIASEIVSEIRSLSGKRLKDDATIIVSKLVKSL